MSAFCDRLVTAPLPYTHTDLLLQVHGFFLLTFRVSSGLFFTLVCNTYLLTSRVLVNVGFVQLWCLVECDLKNSVGLFDPPPLSLSLSLLLTHSHIGMGTETRYLIGLGAKL